MHFVKIKNNLVCKNPTFYEALVMEQFPFVTVQVIVKLSAGVGCGSAGLCLNLEIPHYAGK